MHAQVAALLDAEAVEGALLLWELGHQLALCLDDGVIKVLLKVEWVVREQRA